MAASTSSTIYRTLTVLTGCSSSSPHPDHAFTCRLGPLVVSLGRLYQFHQVPGRILDQRLPDGDAPGDAGPDGNAGAAERVHGGSQVGDLNRDPVPPPRRRD